LPHNLLAEDFWNYGHLLVR